MRKLITFISCFISLGVFAQVNQFSGDTVRNSVAIKLLVGNDGIGVDTTDALRVDVNLNIDSLAAQRVDVNLNIDTLAVHRTDINGYQVLLDSDSIRAGAMLYTNTYWEDLRVPLQNTKLTPSKSEPAFEQIGATGLYAFAFDAANDSDESLHFAAQIPHAWKVGTDLEFHVHWYPSTTNTGNVVFELDYIAVAIDGTMGASAQTITDTIAADGTAFKHQVDDIGTIDGSALSISSMIICRFTRLGDDAADTFTGVVLTNEVDFHFQGDAPVSTHEYVK